MARLSLDYIIVKSVNHLISYTTHALRVMGKLASGKWQSTPGADQQCMIRVTQCMFDKHLFTFTWDFIAGTGVPVGNLHRHRENIQTLQRNAPVRLEPRIFFCDTTVLATAPCFQGINPCAGNQAYDF